MSSKKKIAIPVIIVICVAAVVFLYFKFFKGGNSGNPVYVQSVRAVSASAGSLQNRFGGVVETQKTEKVEFDSSMILAEVYVKEGDRVEEGDDLFAYDTTTIDLKIQQMEIEIERYDTNIADSNAQIASLEKMMASANSTDRLGYSAQITQLRATIAQAEYDKKTKIAELDRVKASLDSTVVTAPMSGTVKSIADVGGITAGTNTGPDGMPDNSYITIVADGNFRIKGTVSEQNIMEINPEDRVLVRSRVDDTLWRGVITSIDTQAVNDGANQYYYSSGERAAKYSFYVDLDETEGLMLGQHVTIELDKGQADGREGIWLSSGWIVQDGASAHVWTAKAPGERLEKRNVTLGQYDEETDEYQLTAGLSLSDYIAWPDIDCTAGAATTTEILASPEEGEIPEEGGMMEDGMWTEEGGMMEDGMYTEEEMVMPEGGPYEVYDGAAVPGYADEAETESEKPED